MTTTAAAPALPDNFRHLLKQTVTTGADGLPHHTAEIVAPEVEAWREHGMGWALIVVRQYLDFDAKQRKPGRLDVIFVAVNTAGQRRGQRCGAFAWHGPTPLEARAAWDQARQAYLAARAWARTNPEAYAQARAALSKAREAHAAAVKTMHKKLDRLTQIAANAAANPNARTPSNSLQRSVSLAAWGWARERFEARKKAQAAGLATAPAVIIGEAWSPWDDAGALEVIKPAGALDLAEIPADAF